MISRVELRRHFEDLRRAAVGVAVAGAAPQEVCLLRVKLISYSPKECASSGAGENEFSAATRQADDMPAIECT